MRIRAVLKVKVNAFFFTQALNELQVRLVVLHAIHALGIGRAELEFIITGQNAVLFQHLRDDLAHCFLLENPLVDPVL